MNHPHGHHFGEFLRQHLKHAELRIPVNVTADSGNVTGIPANVTEGRCCAF